MLFDDATIRYVEIKATCKICGKPATFRGMPMGLSPQRPTMACDGTDCTLPFMFGDEKPTGTLLELTGQAVTR